MKYFHTVFLVAGLLLLLNSTSSLAAVNEPDGDFAFYEDATFRLKGDYLGYFKYFSERDLNGYNGNHYYIHPVTGNTIYTQTEQIERFWQHELRLYPKIIFNDKLEFKMRLDVGPYLFQSDLNERILILPDNDDEEALSVVEDNEKLKVKEANLMMVTPIGLFLVGRFETDKHGLVYGIQLPQFPKWTFVVPWLIKHEGKRDVESIYIDYTRTRSLDYLDNDDQNETAFISIYDNGSGFKSQQWIEARLSDGDCTLAKNTQVFLPQWKIEWETETFDLLFYIGLGFGTIAELSKMDYADDLRDLVGLGNELATSLHPTTLSAPSIVPEDLVVESSKNIGIAGRFRLGRFTPELGFWRIDGATTWYETAGLLWDEYEPEGYRSPRLFKLLLFGEIEDKYFPLFATLSTAEAFNTDDICYTNVTGIKMGTSYKISEKWEIYGQAVGLWRTKTDYFEDDYWEFFPVMYALNNMTDGTNPNGDEDTLVPLLLKRNDVDYATDVDPFLGVEINGSITYKLFDGLNISLLGSYFKIGGFYEDVMTPKPYTIQWAWRDSQEAALAPDIDADEPITEVWGPYLGASDFDPVDAWTVQLQVDFKFEI